MLELLLNSEQINLVQEESAKNKENEKLHIKIDQVRTYYREEMKSPIIIKIQKNLYFIKKGWLRRKQH